MSEYIPLPTNPIQAIELVVGEIYFTVHYVDNDMLLPVMETLVYLGSSITNEFKDRLVFQDLDSYTDLGIYPNNEEPHPTEKLNIYSWATNSFKGIYNLDDVVIILKACSERRKKQ